MPFRTNDRNLSHVSKVLPADAFTKWCTAANEAEALQLSHNDCVRSAWDIVGEEYEKGGEGKKWVRKVGARNSAADKKKIQDVHDHAVSLGAECSAENSPTVSKLETGDVHVPVPLKAGYVWRIVDGLPKQVKIEKREPIEENTLLKFEATNGTPVVVDHGLVMGFAIVSKKEGVDYYDVQGDHIPEDAMLSASIDFMENSRVAKEMHRGEQVGGVVFALPITEDVRKYIIDNDTTGLFIGMRPGAAVVEKFKSGEYTGFSIGGERITDEEVD